MNLEKMEDFFAARAEGYDEHMLNDVPGCKNGYRKMAELVPAETKELLDLGCGTGLELDEIFKRYPDLSVTGVDMTEEMLAKLRKKHPDKRLTLVKGDYFKVDFGKERFDAAVSFQTMHHFSHSKKLGLYAKIYDSLRKGGVYIECDYMIIDQAEEDFYYAENARLREELGLSEGTFYHYDTPCTIANQMELFKKAGFIQTEMVFREENTTILVGRV